MKQALLLLIAALSTVVSKSKIVNFFFNSFIKEGILYIDELQVETNKSLAEATVNFYNAPLKDTVLSGTIYSYQTWSGCTLYVTVSIQINPYDTDYRYTLVKTTVDLKRLLTGVLANPLIKSVTENLLSALDFEIKFPFKPVSNLQSLKKVEFRFFSQGTYNIKKFSLTDKFIIQVRESKVKVDLRFIGKVPGKKKHCFAGRLVVFGRYIPPVALGLITKMLIA